jgi:hypothetical protein
MASDESKTLLARSIAGRKARVGKSIAPGVQRGLLEVSLFYKNRAAMIRDGATIEDFVPANFRIREMSNSCDWKPIEGGTLISWRIDHVLPGEEVELKYTVEATDDACTMKNPAIPAFK